MPQAAAQVHARLETKSGLLLASGAIFFVFVPAAAQVTGLTPSIASVGSVGDHRVAVSAQPVPGRRLKHKAMGVDVHAQQGCEKQMCACVLTPPAAWNHLAFVDLQMHKKAHLNLV